MIEGPFCLFQTVSKLDFSHGAAYQSASIKCFIRAHGTFCGSVSVGNPQKVFPSAYDCRQRTRCGSSARRASGLRKLARKRHRVHFSALRPSTIRAGHAPRSAHFERMGEERIYPFLRQMAKVELEEVRRILLPRTTVDKGKKKAEAATPRTSPILAVCRSRCHQPFPF